MTTSELITHTDLTFLGHIYLGHLQDTRRQFITDGDSELTALQLCIKQLVLLDVVHDQFLNEIILVLIISPAVTLDSVVLEILQRSNSELTALGDDLSTCIILHTL